MNIVVHPLIIFDMTYDRAVLADAHARFLAEVRGGVLLHMDAWCAATPGWDDLVPEVARLYRRMYRELCEAAAHVLHYPSPDSLPYGCWAYPSSMDEIMLESTGNIVFSGGYFEDCVARSIGAFRFAYEVFLAEQGRTININPHCTIVAHANGEGQRYWLDKIELCKHVQESYNVRSRCTKMDLAFQVPDNVLREKLMRELEVLPWEHDLALAKFSIINHMGAQHAAR